MLNHKLDKLFEGNYNKIMIINVEVINDGAYNLLSELERLNLIRLNTPAKDTVDSKKLSKQFAGTLKLSDAMYESFQNTIQKGRNEWTRDIC